MPLLQLYAVHQKDVLRFAVMGVHKQIEFHANRAGMPFDKGAELFDDANILRFEQETALTAMRLVSLLSRPRRARRRSLR
jgi:hypothetical protein